MAFAALFLSREICYFYNENLTRNFKGGNIMGKINRISVSEWRSQHDFDIDGDTFTTKQWHDIIWSLNKYLAWPYGDYAEVEVIASVPREKNNRVIVWNKDGFVLIEATKYKLGNSIKYKVTYWQPNAIDLNRLFVRV